MMIVFITCIVITVLLILVANSTRDLKGLLYFPIIALMAVMDLMVFGYLIINWLLSHITINIT